MKDLLIREYVIDKSATRRFSLNRRIDKIKVSLGECHVLFNEYNGVHQVFSFGSNIPKTSDLIKYKFNKGYVFNKSTQFVEGEYKYNCFRTYDNYYTRYSVAYEINDAFKVCNNINIGVTSEEIIKNSLVSYIKRKLKDAIKFNEYEYNLCKDVIDTTFERIQKEEINIKIQQYGLVIKNCCIEITGSDEFNSDSKIKSHHNKIARENDILIENVKLDNEIKKSKKILEVQSDNEIKMKQIEENKKLEGLVNKYNDDPRNVAILDDEIYKKIKDAESDKFERDAKIENTRIELLKKRLDTIDKLREEGYDEVIINEILKKQFDQNSSVNYIGNNVGRIKSSQYDDKDQEKIETNKDEDKKTSKYAGKFRNGENK